VTKGIHEIMLKDFDDNSYSYVHHFCISMM